MMKTHIHINKLHWLLICTLALGPVAVQAADSMPGMDMGTTDTNNPQQAADSTATTDHSTMDHSKMDMSTTQDSGAMDMDMPGMQMQGGSAPPDARDPHAYSDGQTLDSGDYVLPGPRLIHMADEHNFAGILVDRLERVDTSGPNSTAYDLMAWYGRDYNKLVIKSEGDVFSDTLEESQTDVLWSHAIADYWDAQLGMRYDSSADLPGRGWLAAGVQGLAPYWFEIDATAYVGNDSRSALRLQAEYELLFTQKLILSPRIETNLYGKDDSARGIGSGVSDMTAGIRLRYEIRREFAPYIGVEYTSKYGATADYARAAGADVSDTHWVAGLRFWY